MFIMFEEIPISALQVVVDRNILIEVARTSLRTKLHHKLADHITELVLYLVSSCLVYTLHLRKYRCVVDAVLAIRQDDKEPDLHMIEKMEMHHESDMDTTLIR